MNPSNQKITWPPSPGLVFATLPYLKTAYNQLYRYTFHSLEVKWDMAVQRRPRIGETEEQIALEVQREVADGILEIRVALAEGEDTGTTGPEEGEDTGTTGPEEGEPSTLERTGNTQNPLDTVGLLQPIQRTNANVHRGDFVRAYNLEEQVEPGHMRNELRLIRDLRNLNHQLDTAHPQNRNVTNARLEERPTAGRHQATNYQVNINNTHNHRHTDGEIILNEHQWTVVHNIPAMQFVSSVIGALVFPPIAAIMGDILKYILPSSFIAPKVASCYSSKVIKKGILTERWGRTVIGGCLFVLLKDAFTLYCKWKKARDFGKRIIIDYKGKRNSS